MAQRVCLLLVLLASLCQAAPRETLSRDRGLSALLDSLEGLDKLPLDSRWTELDKLPPTHRPFLRQKYFGQLG